MGAFIHSLVDSSAPSILPPRVRVLRTPSTRLSFIAKFVFVKTSKINKKETGLGPFKNKRTLGRLFSFFAETILVLEMLIALTRSTPRPMTPPLTPSTEATRVTPQIRSHSGSQCYKTIFLGGEVSKIFISTYPKPQEYLPRPSNKQ